MTVMLAVQETEEGQPVLSRKTRCHSLLVHFVHPLQHECQCHRRVLKRISDVHNFADKDRRTILMLLVSGQSRFWIWQCSTHTSQNVETHLESHQLELQRIE